MFNVCPRCGLYAEDKTIQPQDGPNDVAVAVCPHCGHKHLFRRLPLFVLTGASGAGKTAVCLELATAQVSGAKWALDCVYLEQDILWRTEFADPENGYRVFRNTWLRLAKNIAQGGRPVVLSGTAVPEQYEACPERRYLTVIHYLALICDDGMLRQRLAARPEWRRSSDAGFVDRMVEFNRWLGENAQGTHPPISVLDTTGLPISETAKQVAGWIRACLCDGLGGG